MNGNLETPALDVARIVASSRAQAMDWSLVLASQGIDCFIDRSEEDSRWCLLVARGDYERAKETIRLYRHENRAWGWQQNLPWPGISFDWSAVAAMGLLIIFYWLGETSYPALKIAGIMDSAAVGNGEWWRMVTAILLHSDARHLVANVTTGVLLLGLAMGRYGTGIGLFAALLAGVDGNVAGLLVYPQPFLGLGASGMILGALGLLSAPAAGFVRPALLRGRRLFAGLIAGSLLFVLLGMTPGTDIVAHLGGFVSGVLLGTALSHLPDRARQSPVLNIMAGLLAAVLIIASWRLALNGRLWP